MNLNLFDSMLAWENDSLDHESTIKLFQALVDNGMAWTLQGVYGREADKLIKQGFVEEKA